MADTDLLSDRMWVQVQDFFGQRVPQPWADNGALVVNALDNLSGTDALISVRSRGRFSRPFVVVERLQREAETSFRQKEEQPSSASPIPSSNSPPSSRVPTRRRPSN